MGFSYGIIKNNICDNANFFFALSHIKFMIGFLLLIIGLIGVTVMFPPLFFILLVVIGLYILADY